METTTMTKRAYSIALTALLFSLMTAPAQAATASRNSSFVYDPASGLLTKEIIEPNDPQLCLVTEYGYDAFGNKNSVTTRNCNGSPGEAAAPAAGSDAVIASRAATTTYDTRGQFATSSTNALGHSETREFDPSFGTVKKLTGPNLLATNWSYDSFGRKILETRADSTTTTWSYLQTCDLDAGIADVSYCVSTLSSGQGTPTRTYYDSLNRKRATVHIDFSNTVNTPATGWIVEGRLDFNDRGQVAWSYLPYFRGSTAALQYSSISYDELGRVTNETAPNGRLTTTNYSGLTSTVTVSAPDVISQSKTTVKNTQGQTVSITDVLNNIISYSYDPFGNLTKTTDAKGNVTSLSYDTRGRKIGMSDPDMGVWTYAYNALGQLIRQKDAKNQTVTMQYDKLGRMTSRSEPSLNSTWTYDTAVKGIGKLTKATAGNGYSRTHSYDAQGRLSSTSTVIDKPASPYVTGITYDANSRVDTQTYPTGFAVKNVYDANGRLIQVVNAATPSTVYWTANTMDAAGHLTQQTYGNGVTTWEGYDPASGQLTSQYAAGIDVQNTWYTYDSLGNLTSRVDVVNNLTEGFGYDALNRVTWASAYGGAVNTVTSFAYDAIGNITCKSDISSFPAIDCFGTSQNYTYNATVTSGGVTRTLPHAVGKITGTINYNYNPTFTYDANGNMTSGAGRTVAWNSFNMPDSITRSFKTTSFWYNGEHERIKEHQTDGSDVIVLSPRYDTGLHFEKKYIANFGILTGAVEYEHYLYAGGQMFGKYVMTTTTNGVTIASTKTEYYTKDHLGSIVAITNDAGAVTQRLSFDVWGKRRNPNGAADPYGSLNNPDMYHGYTGHEMLDAVGLIHMNGRLYDPLLGRFVSADTTIQSPDDLQSFNRYSYCWNNPLTCIDPSGNVSLGDFFSDPIGTLVDVYHDIIHSPALPTVVNIGLTIMGMPGVGAMASSAISTWQNHGNLGDFTTNLVTSYVSSIVTAPIAGRIGSLAGMNPGGLPFAMMRGSLGGGVGGAMSAAIYGQDVGAGFRAGFSAGGVTAGLMWGINDYRTSQFIKNNLNCGGSCSESFLRTVRSAGQSPVGQRYFSAYRDSGSVLNVLPEASSPAGNGLGPHVIPGTNNMYFDGNVQSRLGSMLASEPWGPTLDDPTTFIHELSHTQTGGGYLILYILSRVQLYLTVSVWQKISTELGWVAYLELTIHYYRESKIRDLHIRYRLTSKSLVPGDDDAYAYALFYRTHNNSFVGIRGSSYSYGLPK